MVLRLLGIEDIFFSFGLWCSIGGSFYVLVVLEKMLLGFR